MRSLAYKEGWNAAREGCNINNSYPYEKPTQEYWDWIDGHRDYTSSN